MYSNVQKAKKKWKEILLKKVLERHNGDFVDKKI